MALFAFKSHLKDFLVDEQLPFALDKSGDFFLLQIEKEHTTTMEVVDHLAKYLKVPKSVIWYAGLKDKFAITKQWFSFQIKPIAERFPDKQVDKLIIWALLKVCRVLKSGYHNKALTIKDDFINHFTITLRASKKLFTSHRNHIEKVLNELLANPIPNFFGEQRFGIGGQNVQQALDILSGKDKEIKGFDRHFKLQAYASHLFNIVLEKRLTKGSKPIDGDVITIDKKAYLYEEGRLYKQQDWHKKKVFFVQASNEGKSITFDQASDYQIMLPVLGYNALIPPQDTEFGDYFHMMMLRNQVTASNWKLFRELEIYGIIRSLTISPIGSTRDWDGDNIVMKFSLGAGSYASVVVDQFLIELGKKPDSKTDTTELVKPRHKKRWGIDRSLPQHKQEKKAKTHRKGKTKPKV